MTTPHPPGLTAMAPGGFVVAIGHWVSAQSWGFDSYAYCCQVVGGPNPDLQADYGRPVWLWHHELVPQKMGG